MKRTKIISLLLGVGVACLVFGPGKSITIETQWPLFESLRTTASIVLGIIGVWLAIIYPHALEKLLEKSSARDEAESRRLRQLLRPLAYTSLILGIVLIYGPVRPMVEQSAWMLRHRDALRGMSFSLLTYLTLLQLWTLILMLVPGEALKDEINGIIRRRTTADRALSRAQKETAHTH